MPRKSIVVEASTWTASRPSCRGIIVAPAEVPPDVITMNSRVKLRDLETQEEMVFFAGISR
jgi:hypothetical protein